MQGELQLGRTAVFSSDQGMVLNFDFVEGFAVWRLCLSFPIFKWHGGRDQTQGTQEGHMAKLQLRALREWGVT